MPDPLESAGQDMQQETANKLIDIQANHLLARVVPVIFPVKADLAIDAIDQTLIGNSRTCSHLGTMTGTRKFQVAIFYNYMLQCEHKKPSEQL